MRGDETPAPPPGRAATLLAAWFSAGFPTGAFAWSHGLETALAEGHVRDAATLRPWLADLLAAGGPWTDAVLFSEAMRRAVDDAALAGLSELAEALAPSAERARETLAQGSAFLAAVSAGWPAPALDRLPRERGPAYPVAAGAACAAHDLPAAEALPVFLNATVANLVSAAIRLAPIGQSAGLATLAALQPLVWETAERARAATLDDLGGLALLSDIASQRHETLQPRIFRA